MSGKRFTKGLLFGGLLGAGLVWMNTTKRGKQFKNKLLEHANTVSKEVLKRIPENEWVDQKKVEKVLKQVVEEYGETKDMAKAAMNMVKKQARSQIKKRTRKS